MGEADFAWDDGMVAREIARQNLPDAAARRVYVLSRIEQLMAERWLTRSGVSEAREADNELDRHSRIAAFKRVKRHGQF